jgi:hypothetical protein
MININFIITCCDREAYWPYLKKIIESYKQIIPHIALCYNGADKNFPCDFKCGNRKGAFSRQTDGELIVGGFLKLKGNNVSRWIKLSVDSWLCREQSIVDLIAKMDTQHSHYAGCKWYGRSNQYSTDIIFSDTMFMQKFVEFIATHPNRKQDLETCAAYVMNLLGGAYMIPERTCPAHRHVCQTLGWTMQHDLKKNIETARKFGAQI